MAEQIKYYMFSLSQLDFQKKIAKKRKTKITERYVIKNGSKYQYTEVLSDPTKSIYTDAKVVASGTAITTKTFTN